MRTSFALAAVLRSTAQSDSGSTVVSNKVVSMFCVPGTTAGVERLFSIAGFVLSNRRLSLTDANFHNHVFAHCNFGLAASDQSKRKFDDK